MTDSIYDIITVECEYIEWGIRLFGFGAFECVHFITVDLILARLNIDNQKLTDITILSIRTSSLFFSTLLSVPNEPVHRDQWRFP